MSEKVINNNRIQGIIDAPPSKSQTIRVIAGASLSPNETVISNYSKCDDALAAIEIIRGLGSDINYIENDLIIKGGKPEIITELNCRESAFCLRLFSVIASLYDYEIELMAENSLLKRKTDNIESVLNSFSVECKTNKGYPPIKVKGPIKGGNLIIDCTKSSQLLSGLLFSLPLVNDDSLIEVSNLNSKPYIDLTMNVLKEFGIEIENENYKFFRIKGRQNFKNSNFVIEGDWSSASNYFVAGAINGEIEINNMKLDTFQGDKVIINLLSNIGAEVTSKGNSIKVTSNKLKSFEFNAADYPDLVPILTVLGCFCEGESIISDISRLSGKESSRAEIIAKELNSIGGKIRLEGSKLIINNSTLHEGLVNSHGDHRIAMALAVAGLNSTSHLTINGAECVSKSYPGFWNDLDKLIENSNFIIHNAKF